MRFDILITPSMRELPIRLLESLYHGALALGIDAQIMKRYAPRAGSVLMLYGLGGHDRFSHANAHRQRGGRFVAWDAGYWERKTDDRKYRLAIDGFHCPALVMRGADPGPARWQKSAIAMRSTFDRLGDIVLVGNGLKSGARGADGWAAAKSREIRQLHPKRRIIYRPKRGLIERGVVSDFVAIDQPIDKVVCGASLVVCRHSNVAVDACVQNIPVVCEDGAASAIYPSRLENEAQQPSHALRHEFLRRLAWWQWTQTEAERGEPWPWLLRQLA